MTVLKDQFPREKEQNPDTPKDEETGREDKRFMGNFMGLALTFSLHHKAPQQHGWGFYRILSWQNTEFHDAQSTTNAPGLLLAAPGMKNQLSHSKTNPNLKEKTVGMKLFPPQTQPQTWGP